VTDVLAQNVDKKICERQGFRILEILYEFPGTSHTVLYQIITFRLGCYQKFHPRWVPKMLTGAHKTQRMASALYF
jgi:hypothetical protein